MTPLREIIAGNRPTDAGFIVDIPRDWMQGRTTYGGLSAALALEAARRLEFDLPPLRSAQISFIGPLAGAVTVTATKLRRGRTAAFIQTDIMSEAGLGFRATFVFMANQPSRIALDQAPRHDRAPPSADTPLYTGPDEFFTGNFNFRDVGDEALGPAGLLRWARLRDAEGIDPVVHLMAIADALPPAAFKLLGNVMAPISSLTWIVNLLTAEPVTRDGWWLLTARADQAANGCSSQRMTIWAADGLCVAEGMQSVAIFA